MNTVKIKICGLTSLADVRAVNPAKPDWAGLVFYPGSRRYVSLETARRLREALDPAIVSVGVFVDAPKDLIVSLCQDKTVGVVQLHGGEDDCTVAALRDTLPGTEIWKAIRIRSVRDLEAAARCSADRVLLDNGGGTGERFDWSLLRDFPRPFILAGGLKPETIRDAAELLHPFGVDLSSGVETDGIKDKEKISAAVKAARSGT